MSDLYNHSPNDWPTGFEFIRVVGSGGRGVVLLVRDIELDVLRAMKIIKVKDSHRELSDAQLAEAREGFHAEHKIAASLCEHCGTIVQIHHKSFLPKSREPYAVMRYYKDGPLYDRRQSGYLFEQPGTTGDIRTTLSLLRGPARALAFMHDPDNGEGSVHVHRDVKGRNILRGMDDEHGVPTGILSDFGLARAATAHQPDDDQPATPPYSAPELWDRMDNASPASDLYAFGVTVYKAFTGEYPWLGADSASRSTWKMIHRSVAPAPIDVNDARMKPVLALTLASIAKDPADRPTAKEWQECLEEAHDSYGAPVYGSQPPRMRKPPSPA